MSHPAYLVPTARPVMPILPACAARKLHCASSRSCRVCSRTTFSPLDTHALILSGFCTPQPKPAAVAGKEKHRTPQTIAPRVAGAAAAAPAVQEGTDGLVSVPWRLRCRSSVLGLENARNRPPLPWRWREHGSERPVWADSYAPVLKPPAGSAELPRPAKAAGHTHLREGGNRPHNAYFARSERSTPRRLAGGRSQRLRPEPRPTPFSGSRALGPMLSPSARELWPFFARCATISLPIGAGDRPSSPGQHRSIDTSLPT